MLLHRIQRPLSVVLTPYTTMLRLGGVKGRDGSAEKLDSETGEEQLTVGWTRRKNGG